MTTTSQSTKRSMSPSHLPALAAVAAAFALVACGGPLELPAEGPAELPPAAAPPADRAEQAPVAPPPAPAVIDHEADAVLAAELGELAFLPTSVGSGRSLAFELWNPGIAPQFIELDGSLIFGTIVPGAGTAEGEFAAAAVEGYDPVYGLGPGQAMKIVVSFMPEAIGTRTARLELRSPGGDSVLMAVNLRGEGKDPNRCNWTASARELDFGGLAAGEKRTVNVTLRNDELPGGVSCEANARLMYGSDARFVLTGGQVYPVTLGPGDSVDVEVTFVGADEPGSYLGALMVEVTSGMPGEAVIPLSVRVGP